MNLIVCSEKCVHQQDGYCVLERPCDVPNPRGSLENRCIYLEPPPEGITGPTEGPGRLR